MQGGFGAKGLAILLVCSMREGEVRARYFRAVCDKFSEKSVTIKFSELHKRGYLTGAHALSSLTPRGRQALDSQPMSG